MTALIFLIAFAALLVAAGAAVLLDLTPDTRDSEYGLGAILAPRREPAQRTSDR